MTNLSTRARYRQPIGRVTIVRLNEIKRRMGDKVELFSDDSMLGFNRKQWEGKMFRKFPLDFSDGFKQNLGPFIKTNVHKNKNEITFIVKKKVTAYQLNALIGFLEGKCPPFHYITIYRKARDYEEVYNITGFQEFLIYIKNELMSAPQLHIKIAW